MKKAFSLRKYFFILLLLGLGCLFYYITSCTPLAGDDWGYALSGLNHNPFSLALEFYQSWSGRFFSELYGFAVAPNRWIWNILNPLVFVGIFAGIYALIHSERYYILIPLVIAAIILSVDDNLRMETYTWLMGTTYTLPLVASLGYFCIMDRLFFKVKIINSTHILIVCLCNIILFYVGMTMENIAAAMIVGLVIMIIYAYFNKRSLTWPLIVNLIVLAVSFTLMRIAPGSQYRLLRDHAAWAELSLIAKLVNGYPDFLTYTFINNDYLIAFLSLAMIALIFFTEKKIPLTGKIVSVIIQMMAIFTAFSFVLIKQDNWLLDPHHPYGMIFWIVYTLNVLYLLWKGLKGVRQAKAIFFFILAGSSNLVMLYSPIFGSRSSLYLVFFMIIVIGLVLESLTMPKGTLLVILLLTGGVIVDRVQEYIYKYRLVALREQERLEIIAYYRDHPEVEEAWIPRFPVYTIHGADIEPGDDYHFEVFKEYYALPQEADKIIFMFKEED